MIPIKNIYYMLSYAFSVLQEQGYKELGNESFDNVGDLFSAILYRGIVMQLKQGIHKDYITVTEKTSTLKGKINYTESVYNQTMRSAMMICEYDDYSEDSYLNRILKTAILYLLKSDVSPSRKKDLRKIIIYFKDIKELDHHQINWHIRYNRNNRTYAMLIAICNMLFKSLIQNQEDGSSRLMDYIDERQMHKLYEKFILEFYKKERTDIKSSASQIDWILDDDNNDYLPVMQSDITLQKGNDILIIDAKYYRKSMQIYYDKTTFHSGNLYQLFTYVKNKQEYLNRYSKGQVSGMLLYAKTDESVTPNNNTMVMSGNRIIVHSLDLNRDFSDMKKELLEMADSF